MSGGLAGSRTRVFVPLDPAALRWLDIHGSVAAPAGMAFAVTDRLRGALPLADAEDDEDLEYAALCDASDASIAGASADAGGRRIVAAADVDPAMVDIEQAVAGGSEGSEGSERSERLEAAGAAATRESLVHLSGPLRLTDVVSLHLGEPGGADDDELSWYDVSELHVLLDLLA